MSISVGQVIIEMAANVARLQRDMATARSTVDSNMNSMIRSAKAFARVIEGLGFGAFIKSTINALDALEDFSKKTGVASSQLAGLKFAAGQSGTSLDAISTGLNKLSVNIAKNGEEFKALGISAKDPLDAMIQLADVLQRIEDPQQRAAVATAALGRGWQELAPLLTDGGNALRNLVTQGTAMSGVTDQMTKDADAFNDQLGEMSGWLTGLSIKVIGPVISGFNQLSAHIRAVTEDGWSLINILKGIANFAGGIDVLNGTARQLRDVNDQIAVTEKKVEAMKNNKAAGKMLDDLTGQDLSLEQSRLDVLYKKQESLFNALKQSSQETKAEIAKPIDTKAINDFIGTTEKLTESTHKSSASHASHRAAIKSVKPAIDEVGNAYDRVMKSLSDQNAQLTQSARDYEITRLQAEKLTDAMIEQAMRIWDANAAWEKKKELQKNEMDEISALVDQYNQLTLSSREYYQLSLTKKGIPASDQGAMLQQFDTNAAFSESIKKAEDARSAMEEYNKTLDSAADKTTNLGSLTSSIFDSSLGGVNALVGAFENMLKGIDETKQAYANLAVVKKSIDEFDPSLYKDEEKAIQLKAQNQAKYEKAYQDLQNQTFNQYMDGTRQMAGALTMMFEDNKQAQLANQAVALVTLGIQAVQAIVTQGQGDPYTAFARIAAMAAIVGAMVSSVGGKSPKSGSSGVMAQSKTTGTVLGDKTATSNSIGNVYELLKDIHAEEYAELRGINEGVASLHDSMSSVVTRIYQANSEGIVAPAGILQPSQNLGLGSIGKKGAASIDILSGLPGLGMITKLVTDTLQKYDPVQKLLNKIFFGTVKEKVVGGGYAINPFEIGGQLSASQYNIIERTRKSWISKKTTYREVTSDMDKDVKSAIEDMFNAMGDTMLSTADALGKALGTELSGRVLGYIIPSLRIELYGLNGEEAAKKLNGVMSTVMDDMANTVFGDIVGQYQQLGEGMLETAIRIVSEIAVVTDALKVSGLALKPKNIIEFSDAIVQAMGGLNGFKKSWQDFFEAFYTDAEKQARLKDQLFSRTPGDTGQLTDMFTVKAPKLTLAQKKSGGTVGSLYPDFDPYATLKTLEASRDGYRKVLESININTQAGMKQYATLIKLSAAADQYYQGVEAQAAKVKDLENSRHELELQLMEASGRSVEVLSIRRKDEVAAMDESLRALQESIYVAEDAIIAQQKSSAIAKQQRQLDIQLMEAIGDETGALAAKRSDELAALDESLRATQSAIWAENDLATARKLAADIAKQQRALDIQLMEATGDTAGALAAKRADELAALDDSLKSTQLAIWAALDLSDAQAKAAAAAKEAMDAEKAANDSAVQATKDAISSAMSILTKSVKTERDRITEIYNKSIDSTKSAIDKLTDSIGKLKDLSQSLKSTLEKLDFPGSEAVNRANAQATISAALIIAKKGGAISDTDGLIKALDVVSQPSEALFANFTDYQRDFYKTAISISDLSMLTDKQLTTQDKSLAALEAQLAATEAGYKAQNQKLDSIINFAQAQVDAANGTTDAVMSVEQAIKNLSLKLPSQPSMSIAGYATGGIHSGGWRIVGENGPELENTLPSRIYSNSQSASLLDTSELISELKQLRADVRSGQAVIAANTKDTSKQLRQWDTDGLPATTTA